MKPKFTMILMLLALGVQMVFAQQKTISGTVSDENGLPLPGATVIRAGTHGVVFLFITTKEYLNQWFFVLKIRF